MRWSSFEGSAQRKRWEHGYLGDRLWISKDGAVTDPLGALTVYLAEYETGVEHLVALDQVQAIDRPATDLELVSNAVVP